MGNVYGRLLKVDLTKESVETVSVDQEVVVNFVGGRGLGTRLIWDLVKPGTDPLSPDNVLMFLTGPITGLIGGGHTCVVFKSPETGTIGRAMTGGHWGAELRFAGYDGLIVQGRAQRPTYIRIKDDEVLMMDARHLWGKGVTETERTIKSELGDGLVRVLSCGPAGENLVRYASLIQESWRAAGRGGPGAVMGSKNLKAVAVRGTKGLCLHDTPTALKLVGDFTQRLLTTWSVHGRYAALRYGTMKDSIVAAQAGILAVKNQREGYWKEVSRTGGVRLERRNVIAHAACHGCPASDLHISLVRTGPYAGTVSQIDFDSSATLGPNCLVKDIDGLMYVNALCDELGLDAESTGYVISWAMECYEKGLLTQEDLDGIKLEWGSVEAMISLILKIVKREGIGDLLAQGLKYAVQRVGKGSDKFAMHAKGMGFGGWHAVVRERGLQYAVGDRGGCHHYGMSIEEQNWRAWADSLTCCTWHQVAVGWDYIKLASAATGLDFGGSREEWDKTAERILILARAYNIREGIQPLKEDVLPERIHTEPLSYGRLKGSVYPKEEFLRDRAQWYQKRGCNEKGVPTPEHLRELGLDFVIPELKRIGAYDL
ncbi:MAG: aldehyde ferredoxin oxidoreductase family protein [Nitrososphaerota archaeon]